MPAFQSASEMQRARGSLVLGVDTCGPSGTVTLARIERPNVEISNSTAFGHLTKVLGQIALEGKTYSSTLVSGVEALLTGQDLKLVDVGAIVVVNGPGSFTGIRVGVSAVKGLAEPGQVPVVAVSRLAVLAAKAGVGSGALDAHRHEVFLRIASADGTWRQLLAGVEEISRFSNSRPGARMVAVCDDTAAEMVGAAWSDAEIVRVEAPTASDAIRLCVPAILAGEFDDLALLDGHYLRRSDAEIFGDPATKARHA